MVNDSELLSCDATGMRCGPQSVARIRRLQAAQIRLHSQRLEELRTELAGIQEELTAAVDYLRDHESRLAGHESRLAVSERRLNGHEGELAWCREAIQSIVNSRAWKTMARIGWFARKTVTGG